MCCLMRISDRKCTDIVQVMDGFLLHEEDKGEVIYNGLPPNTLAISNSETCRSLPFVVGSEVRPSVILPCQVRPVLCLAQAKAKATSPHRVQVVPSTLLLAAQTASSEPTEQRGVGSRPAWWLRYFPLVGSHGQRCAASHRLLQQITDPQTNH